MEKTSINSTLLKFTEDMHSSIYVSVRNGSGQVLVECLTAFKDISSEGTQETSEGHRTFGPAIDEALSVDYQHFLQGIPTKAQERVKRTVDDLQVALALVHWVSLRKLGVADPPTPQGVSALADMGTLAEPALTRRLDWLNHVLDNKIPSDAKVFETLREEVLKPYLDRKSKQTDSRLQEFGAIFKFLFWEKMTRRRVLRSHRLCTWCLTATQ